MQLLWLEQNHFSIDQEFLGQLTISSASGNLQLEDSVLRCSRYSAFDALLQGDHDSSLNVESEAT